MNRQLVVVAHNLRSAHNVGSLLRTADGLGVQEVVLSGYTPYPVETNDRRLPHEAQKIDRQISKTALGAQNSQLWRHTDDIQSLIREFKNTGYQVMALEQTPGSQALPSYVPAEKVVIVLGREVEGLEPSVVAACYGGLEIPMAGHKESFNVVQAAAMALYHCCFWPFSLR